MIWPPPRPQPPDVPDDEPGEWPSSGPDVHETDNPVLATLYGTDGGVLVEIRERRTIPFGYQRGAHV